MFVHSNLAQARANHSVPTTTERLCQTTVSAMKQTGSKDNSNVTAHMATCFQKRQCYKSDSYLTRHATSQRLQNAQ